MCAYVPTGKETSVQRAEVWKRLNTTKLGLCGLNVSPSCRVFAPGWYQKGYTEKQWLFEFFSLVSL